ncbi:MULTISPECIES: type I glutamate--ammonia ligase [unclassified Methanoregula]|uniref:type I glutamate--ammonia ligase n=1 Tax=unclassified Methanoregula TaxID=2649730 RepID=UPI0009C9459E|nr:MULTISPECIES: type I glutamate--ammonia ligase [unclassified Methanoregula]OPX64868.1 MAG: Glutamine synthetase [Methanoregula sp. PtaB.Bin085]OPY32920.1 MAG: Glutamine synthetase [Methanoregula sp. PtaU1.Bin006]
MPTADVTKMLERIRKDDVKFVRLQFTDVLGMPKNAAIPVAQAEKSLTEGTWFDGSSIEGFTRIEESDMLLKADPASYAVLPWRPEEGKVARFMCDVYTYGNKPFEGDPRYVLKRMMAEAAKSGYTYYTGPELEFFLFNLVNGKPSTEFSDTGAYFDLAPNDASENVRREIVLSLTKMGFEIEMSHHEVAASQHEINFKYTDAVTTADRVITQKFATKAIALKYGLHASFMAKPIAGINGSGMHTHASLSKNGKNAFFDANGEKGLSDTALYYIGGILKHAKAITRVANPTINSYKRLVPGYEAPCYISWSATNRSALIRVPAARGNGTRAEFRSPDPMCNPYLTFACMLAAGLDGIRNKIMPPDSTDRNIYHLSDKERKKLKIEMLPGSLAESHHELLRDKVICDALGPHIVDTLTNIAVAETDAFRLAVHPWEIDRYLATY